MGENQIKKCIITGHVGQDPESRADQSGNNFTTFSVGVSVGNKQNPKTDWCTVSCTGNLAEIARLYVKKGSKVLVEGFPSVNAYQNKEGKIVGTLRIYANNIEFISSKEDKEKPNSEYTLPEVSHETPVGSLTSDEIPF